MAVLASIASGNFTTASTWGLVDATSYLNAQHTVEALLTTAYSATRSAAFTPGAIDISHIGVKICQRMGTTGTISVHLILSATNVEVTGTEVTIDVADLPDCLETTANGGWIFFKLASPVTLAAATAYKIEAKTSSASQVDLWCDTTADNISRALVTTTTQAPAAGDDMIVAGEHTGSGTGNDFTVTMNNVLYTDFGSAPTAANSLITPGISICKRGTLTWETTAATDYVIELENSLVIYSGGTMNMGTLVTPCPRNSSMTLRFLSGSNADYGLNVRDGGRLTTAGLSRTSGKDIVSCLLNTDEAVNSISLGVDTDTGWLDNDDIGIASTTRTAAQFEANRLNGDAGVSSLTVDGGAGVGGGLAFAHEGTAPVQAEIVLLTRNVKITGAFSSGYVNIASGGVVNCNWTQFNYLGSATSLKRGVDIASATGSCTFNYCSFGQSPASSIGINITGSTVDGITLQNNVFYNMGSSAIVVPATSGTSIIIDSNIAIGNSTANQNLFAISDVGITFTNNIATGATLSGFQITESAKITGTFTGNKSHSNNGAGLLLINAAYGTFGSFTSWRNNSYGAQITGVSCDITNLTAFGNTTANIYVTATGNSSGFHGRLIGAVLNGDSTFSTSVGINFQQAGMGTFCQFINCDLSTASGIKTAHSSTDIGLFSTNGKTHITLINCKLGASTEITDFSAFPADIIISSQKHNQTAGLHKTWKNAGIITIETTTTDGGGHSVMLTPNSASNKLELSGIKGGFFAPIANGQYCTPTFKVYEDATYNGARARLILKRNDALGITADTVIATATAASDLAWESLSGNTPVVTDDGALEFVIDCDGTAGNLFADTVSAVNT